MKTSKKKSWMKDKIEEPKVHCEHFDFLARLRRLRSRENLY
jgi:hypothetical protein